MSLNGKVAIVTGATKGIGRGIAEALVRAGADVCITARKPAEIENTVHELKSLGSGLIKGFVCDVRNYSQVKELFALVTRELNGPDILINNAVLESLLRLPRHRLRSFAPSWK